ncbi:MAG: lipase family protein [Mucilaginibacter sp.]|uniref:lipase family protein n=1 Tax=Mucilaginibacter sp. TaxID=1882438 RepID=UPI0031A2548E
MKDQELGTLLPPNALHYGYFVKAAIEVHKALKNVLSPTQSQYPEFPAGYTLIANIHMTDFFDKIKLPVYFGFIAVEDANPSNIVIAIRGTQSPMEWWDDFQIAPTPYPFAQNAGKVVTGFLKLYESLKVSAPGHIGNPISLKETAASGLKEFGLSDYKQVVLIGHSLGSSLVTLYGLDIADIGDKKVSIYTLASPCTGDHDFVKYYHSVVSRSFRIFNEPDIVPKSLLLLGYSHVPFGFEVNSLLDPEVPQSIGAYHSINTYLYLLGAPEDILNSNTVAAAEALS